jgi:diaminopimelate decarboxylase
MEILDIGGGFPSGELHESTVEALKGTQNDPLGYKMMAEPGRHLCANSCYILARVIGVRNKAGSKCYHLNDSLYHAFNCVLMDNVNFGTLPDQFYGRIDHKQNHKVITAGDVEPADLFGMTCDGLDIISRKLMVPKDVQTGDWLSFGGMGAYTYGPRSRFNGMRSLVDVCEWEGDIGPYETKKPAA